MKNDSLLGAGIFLASGASVAACFGWLTVVFYIGGIISAITAGAIVAGSSLDDC